MYINKILFLSIVIVSTCFCSHAQEQTSDTVQQLFVSYQTQTKGEKIFLHTDKNSYLTGETLWFKLYDLDADNHKRSLISRVAYVEIINAELKTVLQAKIELSKGRGSGSFVLPSSLNTGNYVMRAYTNFMKNFDNTYFFQQPLTIINTGRQPNWRVMEKKDTISLHLFPEGGNLVYGLQSKIGFRLTDQYGKGTEATGFILNNKNDTVVRFKPLKFGIGSFLLTPQEDAIYKAVVVSQKGQIYKVNLPKIFHQGYVMQVEDKGDDKITVTVKGTSKSEKSIIYLLAHTRQQVKLVFGKEINQGKAEWTVDKKLLGEGVSNFILIDANRQPLCERLYFKKPEHKMVVEMVAGIEYEKRTKVDLSISAHDETNRPLQADFSLAVCLIDSVQPLANAGIQSYVWLSSDLNGPVESPEYYFQQKQDDVLREATDNLMLTHGWRRFRWEEIASAQKPVFEFLPEYEGLLAQAKVVDKTSGEPIAGAINYLSVPAKTFHASNAQSTKGGIASFLLNGVYGANELVLQTDSNFNRYRVDLLSPFSENKGALFFPQFYLSTGAKDQLTAHHVNIQISNLFKTAASRRFVLPGEIDTAAFYGKPDKTYVLDEFTRFPTMEEVMREFVTGVRVRKEKERFTWEVMNTPYKLFFNNNPLVLLDGVPVFDVNKIMAFDPLKIKRIDVVAHKHFWGNVVANGIVSFSSYDGDLAGFELDPAAVVLEFQGLQLKREFYSPEYSTSEKQSNRLPDLRNVLYWNPDVQTNRDGKTHLEFYTSDIPGTYAVIVQGLDENGLPGNSIQLFRVSK